MTHLSKADLADIIEGAGFFGSGGGGSVPGARTMLSHAPDDLRVEIVTVETVAADTDALSAVPAFLGAPAAIGPDGVQPASDAFRAMDAWAQSERGKPVRYVVPGELGAINTLVACLVAADLGLGVVDTDGAGRSIPELTMATFAVAGVPMDPSFLVSTGGITEVIHPKDASEAEQLARPIVERPEFGEMGGLATWLMDSELFQRATPIRATLALAHDIGRLLRTEADPVGAVIDRLSGRGAVELCRGTIISSQERTEGGFDVGEVIIEASDGSRTRVDSENENLVAYDAKNTVLGAIPDLLCFLTTTGVPFSHADLDTVGGQEVALVRVDADPALRDPVLAPYFADVLRRIGAPS